MAAASPDQPGIPRIDIVLADLDSVKLPEGISREIFVSAATSMLNICGSEGWHGGITALVPENDYLGKTSTPCSKPNGLHKGFLADNLNYGHHDEAMKAMLRDAMAWDGAHVVGPDGTIIGVNRKLNAPSFPSCLEGGFGTKHNSALAYAAKFPAVVIVRSDDMEKGVTILSQPDILQGKAYKLSTSADSALARAKKAEDELERMKMLQKDNLSKAEKAKGQDLETYKLYDHHNRCWVMIDSGNWITKTDKERDASVFTDYCEDNVCYIKTHDGYFGSSWQKGIGNYSWGNASGYAWDPCADGTLKLVCKSASGQANGQNMAFRTTGGKPWYYSCDDYEIGKFQKFAV